MTVIIIYRSNGVSDDFNFTTIIKISANDTQNIYLCTKCEHKYTCIHMYVYRYIYMHMRNIMWLLLLWYQNQLANIRVAKYEKIIKATIIKNGYETTNVTYTKPCAYVVCMFACWCMCVSKSCHQISRKMSLVKNQSESQISQAG